MGDKFFGFKKSLESVKMFLSKIFLLATATVISIYHNELSDLVL